MDDTSTIYQTGGSVCRRDLVRDNLYKRVGEIMPDSSSTALCSSIPYPV